MTSALAGSVAVRSVSFFLPFFSTTTRRMCSF
jgi:hypothetical protein